MSCIWLAIAEGREMPVQKSDVFVNLVHLYVEDFCFTLAVCGQFSQTIKLIEIVSIWLHAYVQNLVVAYTVFSDIYLVAYIYIFIRVNSICCKWKMDIETLSV